MAQIAQLQPDSAKLAQLAATCMRTCRERVCWRRDAHSRPAGPRTLTGCVLIAAGALSPKSMRPPAKMNQASKFDLTNSVFAPRLTQADSRKFYETDECAG